MKKWIFLVCVFSASLGATEKESASSTVIEEFPDPLSPWQWVARVSGRIQFNSHRSEDWSLQTIQPLWLQRSSYRNTLFVQFRGISQSWKQIFDTGLGYRYLFPNDQWLIGANGFFDTWREYSVQRWSVGADIQTPWITLNGNYYNGMNNWRAVNTNNGITNWEQALSGGDVGLTIPLPYLPWFRVGAGYYHWNSVNKANIDGYTVFGDLHVFGPFVVQAGRRADNLRHNNFIALSVRVGVPEYIQYTFANSKIAKKAFPRRNLKRFVLNPVTRFGLIQTEKRQTGSNGILIGRS